MSEDPFPGSSADFYERIIKLKEELEHLKTFHRALMFQYLEARQLVTELCDALDEIGHVTQAHLSTEYWQKRKRLIELGREVTR